MADLEDDDTLLAEGEDSESLSDEIAERWDPERLLSAVARRAGRGERLDETTRARYERRLGVDLSRVRIYTGEFAEEVTRAHGAEAVTIGTTGMILMRGTPDKSMATTAGRALLAHELTHVAQSLRGVHRAASFGDSAPLATEEHEAEAEAAEAAEHQDAAGGDSDTQDARADEEAVREAVRERVLQMIADSERVRRLRNGSRGFRP
jgi:hypothetical protein